VEPRMKPLHFLAWALGFVGAVLAGPAAAQTLPGEGFALLVGSNQGGQGQNDLRYAERDTERVEQLLTSLGGYRPERVVRLSQPSVSELRAAIERIREAVQPLAANGTQSRFFFYYSGHARADALNLGNEQLPLAELRERITALPATLSIVVLDACQSGAFSRPKGAAPIGDFSFNSVERLSTSGIAVIASSNERELSQESDELKSSYFTHHWLVGLRGAGDSNADGRVTLSEAYHYAYGHTLAGTAQTSVGEQHPTLETNLTGQDEIPLTQPAAASARLLVPEDFEGRLLLQIMPSWSVLAEVDKVGGKPMLLALPPGYYAATVRQHNGAARCGIQLRNGVETVLELNQCLPIARSRAEIKGDRDALRAARVEALRGERELRRAAEYAEDLKRHETLVIEVGMAFGYPSSGNKYISRLHTFSFSEDSNSLAAVHFTAAFGYRVLPQLLVGLSYLSLETREWKRNIDIEQRFEWYGHALFAFAQWDFPQGFRRTINPFLRLGLGGSLVTTEFDAVSVEPDFKTTSASFENTTMNLHTVTQYYVRPAGYLSAGLDYTPGRNVGLRLELRYVLAPALSNEFHDVEYLGGLLFGIGLRVRSWER
jgi:hypothetical protein